MTERYRTTLQGKCPNGFQDRRLQPLGHLSKIHDSFSKRVTSPSRFVTHRQRFYSARLGNCSSTAVPDAVLGNCSRRCSNSCIPAVVPPPSDLHGWRKCRGIVGNNPCHGVVRCSTFLRPCRSPAPRPTGQRRATALFGIAPGDARQDRRLQPLGRLSNLILGPYYRCNCVRASLAEQPNSANSRLVTSQLRHSG